MACGLTKIGRIFGQKLQFNVVTTVRYGHHLRGKPPGVARTLEQRLEELNYKDPSLHYRVDIGLPPPVCRSRAQQVRERMAFVQARRKDPQLENLARNRKLLVNMDEVNKDWNETTFYHHIKQIADHYGVFEHLYGEAYFLPVVPLSIKFNTDDGQHPVYFGNVIKPSDAGSKPEVTYKSDDEDALWTLVLTNPDGNFVDQDKEYVHWFVANIPGNQIEKGETIVEYLQPFPPKGTGYHRFVFVLYKQEKRMDFSKFRKEGPCLELMDRTFSTLDFYREIQDDVTPAGLAFFQSDWDKSLTDFYHNTLDMKEPIFEYDFPPPYIRRQEWFPIRKPFNLYMDKYRDPKQINKEFLIRKLKDAHPFKQPPAPLPYPNAVYFEGYYPEWLKTEIRKVRLRQGRINEIEKE